MRIVCPTCSAAYDVPPVLLGSVERKVRCAKCQHEWVPKAARDAAAAAPPPSPVPSPPAATLAHVPPMVAAPMPLMDDLPDEPAESPAAPSATASEPAEPWADLPRIDPEIAILRRPKPGANQAQTQTMVALAASVLILCGMAAAAATWRAQVMQVWPPSERVFAAIGLR